MLSEKSRNNVNFVRIVIVLRNLLASGLITGDEYKIMQNNLKEFADKLYKESLDNFKNLIERKKNG